MKRWLPQWVSEYRDRHGKPRYRFRRKGYAQYLFKASPGTESFRQEYQACLQGIAAEPVMPGVRRVRPGSFNDLIGRYYRSPDFLDPSERTREFIEAQLSAGAQSTARDWSEIFELPTLRR